MMRPPNARFGGAVTVMRYLLDADAVIDFLNGTPSTAELIDELYLRNEIFCTCDVVIAEVYSGLVPSERKDGQILLESLLYLTGTPGAARQAGLWRYEFRRRGRQLTTTDCLVAAISHGHGATLVTGNTRHFPMPEITVLPLPR